MYVCKHKLIVSPQLWNKTNAPSVSGERTSFIKLIELIFFFLPDLQWAWPECLRFSAWPSCSSRGLSELRLHSRCDRTDGCLTRSLNSFPRQNWAHRTQTWNRSLRLYIHSCHVCQPSRDARFWLDRRRWLIFSAVDVSQSVNLPQQEGLRDKSEGFLLRELWKDCNVFH